MLPKVRQFLRWMNNDLQRGRRNTKRFTAKTADNIVDWDEINLKGNEILSPAIFDVLVYAGKKTFSRQLIQKQGFDPIGEAVVGWSSEHTAAMVTEVVDETRKGINEIVKHGLKEGLSNQKINMALRPTIGLQSRHALAVGKEYTRLLDAGVSEARALKKMEAYTNKLHRYRARMIARTEAAAASNEGIRQGYDQMGVRRLKRIEAPDAPDDDCAQNNGRIYTIAEAKGVLPAHPQCRGSWVAAAGEKLEPYTIDATGPREAKVPTLEAALKDLPRSHAMRVEKFYIDTKSQLYASAPELRGQAINGYWSYADKAVHLNVKTGFTKQTIFHEVGHAVYSTGGVPYPQKPLWQAWYKKATFGQIKYPSQYALTNESEFFAECYTHYWQKKYHLIDDGIKKWFDKTFIRGR